MTILDSTIESLATRFDPNSSAMNDEDIDAFESELKQLIPKSFLSFIKRANGLSIEFEGHPYIDLYPLIDQNKKSSVPSILDLGRKNLDMVNSDHLLEIGVEYGRGDVLALQCSSADQPRHLDSSIYWIQIDNFGNKVLCDQHFSQFLVKLNRWDGQSDL